MSETGLLVAVSFGLVFIVIQITMVIVSAWLRD